MKNIFIRLLATFVLFTFLLNSCKKSDDTLVHLIKDEYNAEDQNEIGNSLKKLILTSPDRIPILNQSEYQEFYTYINTLLSMLSNTNNVENRLTFDWEAFVIEDDNITTAFITPGGKFFIYTGLLKFIKSENELFSILAHEINYADSGNILDRLASEYGKDVIGDLLLGHDIPETRNVAYNIKNLVFEESEVLVADRYAMTLICPFQYEALGLKTFLDAANNGIIEIGWLATHPSAITRIESIEEYARSCGTHEDTFSERYAEHLSLLP